MKWPEGKWWIKTRRLMRVLEQLSAGGQSRSKGDWSHGICYRRLRTVRLRARTIVYEYRSEAQRNHAHGYEPVRSFQRRRTYAVRKQSFNFPVQIQTRQLPRIPRISDFVHQHASLISLFCINISLKRIIRAAPRDFSFRTFEWLHVSRFILQNKIAPSNLIYSTLIIRFNLYKGIYNHLTLKNVINKIKCKGNIHIW